jgi:5'-3' exonuclease
VDRITKRFDTDDVLMCISVGRNFRYSVDETYKANRKGTRKPAAYMAVLERVEKEWPHFKFDGLEADDIMGIFATRDANTIICSADKDMKTIPSTIWNGKDLMKIDRATADWWFFYQVLVGDTADGYPGAPGIGPKKAEAILQVTAPKSASTQAADWWRAVVKAYESRGLTEADAIKQARLARILRNEDWDAEKKEPILWTP